ncbi:hypothetical protein EVAR_19520_1 [Eumeta japonica]|uniref:Uncharacterized protein n=1 Tax=Eumeta variegata TaxID=151549 RepID=A0A4C1UFW4_EUMVA|nr:hypothetical protein EVAR_19520_1 [Eumeta japonica]
MTSGRVRSRRSRPRSLEGGAPVRARPRSHLGGIEKLSEGPLARLTRPRCGLARAPPAKCFLSCVQTVDEGERCDETCVYETTGRDSETVQELLRTLHLNSIQNNVWMSTGPISGLKPTPYELNHNLPKYKRNLQAAVTRRCSVIGNG